MKDFLLSCRINREKGGNKMAEKREYACPECGYYLGTTTNTGGGASKVCGNCKKRIKIKFTPQGVYCAVEK